MSARHAAVDASRRFLPVCGSAKRNNVCVVAILHLRGHCARHAPSLSVSQTFGGAHLHTAQRRRCATLLICKRLRIPERSRSSLSKRERIRKRKGEASFMKRVSLQLLSVVTACLGGGGRQRRENILQSKAHVLAPLLKVFVRNPVCAPVFAGVCAFVCVGESSS